MFVLRPEDQEKDVERIRKAYAAGARAPLFVAPTGYGKTVVIAWIVRQAWLKGEIVGVVVHRDFLIEQVSDALTKMGVPHGVIAGDYARTFESVQIVSIDTGIRRTGELPPFTFIVYDEAHHVTRCNKWGRFDRHLLSDCLRFGVTATPERMDGTGLDDVFDHMEIGPSEYDLIHRNPPALAAPRLYAPPSGADLTKVATKYGDYATEQLAVIMDEPKIYSCAITEYERLCAGLPIVVYCVDIDHSKKMAAQFVAAGWPAEHLDGSMSKAQKREILGRFERRETLIVCSVNLLTEGYNMTGIMAAFIWVATKSLAKWRQMCGRSMRLEEGKTEALIVDATGNVYRHGFPDDVIDWTLEGRRKRKEREKGKIIQVLLCPKCFLAQRPAMVCQFCGHQFAEREKRLAEVGGDLRLLTKEELLIERANFRSRQSMAGSLWELYQLADETGRQREWADKVYTARHGREKWIHAKRNLRGRVEAPPVVAGQGFEMVG